MIDRIYRWWICEAEKEGINRLEKENEDKL